MTTSTEKPWQLSLVAVEKMMPGPNVRQDPRMDEIPDLAQSLIEGQWHPVILDPNYVIIDGWRRWMAAQQACIKMLWAIITEKPLSRDELRKAQLAMSFHREGLSFSEQWAACCELMCLHPDWNYSDLAKYIHKSPSTITKIMAPSETVEEVREAFRRGEITFSAVYTISKEKDPVEQLKMLELVKGGVTRDELETIGRKKRTVKASTVRTERCRVELPSKVSITLAGDSMSLEDVHQALLDGAKFAKKAISDGLDSRSFATVMKQKSKATE